MPAPRSQTRMRMRLRATGSARLRYWRARGRADGAPAPGRGWRGRSLRIGHEEDRVRIATLTPTGSLSGPTAERQMQRVAGFAPAGCRASRAGPGPCRRRCARRRRRSASSRPAMVSTTRGGSPSPPSPGGDAARGVAAGAGLAAVGVVDAHEDVGAGVARRLQHDQLVAADAAAAVGEPAPLAGRVSGDRRDRARRSRRSRCPGRASSGTAAVTLRHPSVPSRTRWLCRWLPQSDDFRRIGPASGCRAHTIVGAARRERLDGTG